MACQGGPMNTKPDSVHLRAKSEFSLSYHLFSKSFTTLLLEQHTKPYPGWMLTQPCCFATLIIFSPSRYAEASPKLAENGELKECCDFASGFV